MFINFVFYPQATVRILLFISLFALITPVLAQSPEPLVGYVWDFETNNSAEKDLAEQITEEFEEKFSCFTLLDRRNRDRLRSQMTIENEIRSVTDLSPENKEILLREGHAKMFIFGSLRDNHTEGEITIRVTIESLTTGEILARTPKSVIISPRGRRFDSLYRQGKLGELVRQLCPGPKNISKIFKVEQTKDDFPDLMPNSRNYQRTFNAEPGYRIIGCNWNQTEGNNSTDLECNISMDKLIATFSFRLTSGPIYDRWRGWLGATITLTEELIE